MTRLIMGLVLVAMLTVNSNAALLFLQNKEDGSGEMELQPHEQGTMNIMLTIRDIDTGFAFPEASLHAHNSGFAEFACRNPFSPIWRQSV